MKGKPKRYYGARALGGNWTCTMGMPNPKTGSMSKAVDIQVFRTAAARDTWVLHETFMGSEAGERKAITKQEARAMCWGLSKREFDILLESIEMSRYGN